MKLELIGTVPLASTASSLQNTSFNEWYSHEPRIKDQLILDRSTQGFNPWRMSPFSSLCE